MTSCPCLNFDESYIVYDTKVRKARKEHKCCECGEIIKSGENYQYASGLYDGNWDHHKTCLFCVAVWRDFFKCGVLHRELQTAFKEYYNFDYRHHV